MKKIYALTLMLAATLGLAVNAQTINNPDFEAWENLGTETEEPTSWNSFKTAGGSSFLLSFAAQQVIRSSYVRAGSTGSYCALIWSNSIMGVVANGNVTTGKINMGNISPTNSANYNASVTADPLFSEAFTTLPDSIVFWAKFVSASGNTTDSARMHAVVHDAYDYRDPSGSDANGPSHVVADATKHFIRTNGQWVRFSAPFIDGPATTAAYILLTFTTNKTPGGGSAGDSLYIDDVTFTYNTTGEKEVVAEEGFNVFANRSAGQLSAQFNFSTDARTRICIYNIAGQLLQERSRNLMKSTEVFDINGFTSGIYFMQVTREDGTVLTKKFALR